MVIFAWWFVHGRINLLKNPAFPKSPSFVKCRSQSPCPWEACSSARSCHLQATPPNLSRRFRDVGETTQGGPKELTNRVVECCRFGPELAGDKLNQGFPNPGFNSPILGDPAENLQPSVATYGSFRSHVFGDVYKICFTLVKICFKRSKTGQRTNPFKDPSFPWLFWTEALMQKKTVRGGTCRFNMMDHFNIVVREPWKCHGF